MPSFARDLKVIRDTTLLTRIASAIEGVKEAAVLQDIPNLTKLQGRGNFYRLRIGDYRLGLSIEGDEITFVRCLDRSRIYKQFP